MKRKRGGGGIHYEDKNVSGAVFEWNSGSLLSEQFSGSKKY